MSDGRPATVRVFDSALADWLASFTMPGSLAGEMAEACADGAAWAAAIGGVAAWRAGWNDAESIAWGLCVGGLAGALAAGGRSVALQGARGAAGAGGGEGALPLLAADGLMAAAHEALGSLPPDRAREALEALGRVFADGGPWRDLAEAGAAGGHAAWPALVPCALAPAAEEDPSGPWAAWAEAWKKWRTADPRELWDDPGAEREMKTLLRAAERVARRGPESGG